MTPKEKAKQLIDKMHQYAPLEENKKLSSYEYT